MAATSGSIDPGALCFPVRKSDAAKSVGAVWIRLSDWTGSRGRKARPDTNRLRRCTDAVRHSMPRSNHPPIASSTRHPTTQHFRSMKLLKLPAFLAAGHEPDKGTVTAAIATRWFSFVCWARRVLRPGLPDRYDRVSAGIR